jgi:ABC-type Fe2+-enterobactin transport system substrate-binding protein
MSIAVTGFSCAPDAPVWASSAPKPMKSAAKKYLFIEISQFKQARDLGGVEQRALLIFDQTR